MIKTFISHTSSDHPLVEWVKTRLERENFGLDIFVDDGSVFVGDDPQKMIDEVKRSIIFIPVLSNESIQKEFVQNEIRTSFANKTTHIFPIRFKCDDASIPGEFKMKFTACDRVVGKIYEDFSDEQEWDIHYENLRRAIFNKIVELGLFKEDTKDYYQDCEHLDLILQRDEPTILEIKMIIDVYLKREAYQRYFFSKLTNVRWLKYLKLYGYLRSNPHPIEAVDSPGLFSIPQWDALEYLEKVSSQSDKNDEVIDDLLAIITSVTSLRDANGQHIDNYRTWYYFTKILVNLPTEKIPEEIINLIPVWLDSKFSTLLPSAEIAGKLLEKFLNSDKPEDWKKAERLIEIITAIKWLTVPEKQRSLYERDFEAKTIIEPHWLRKGFEKNFERIGSVCSTNIIEALSKKVLHIFSKQYDHSYDVTYEGKDYQITHALSEDGQHQILVHSLKYPEDWDGFSRNKVERTLVISFMISDFENRAGFASKVKEGLIKNAFASLSTELDEPISAIYTLHDYTYIGYNSLWASFDDIHIDDEKILLYILKEILSRKAGQDVDGTSKLLDKFLSEEYPYPFFKRLVLFVAGREWDKYKEYFFRLLSLEELRCFEQSDYTRELSILLKNNFSKFTADEKDTIRKIVEAGPQYLPEENPEKYKAYWKQKWLSLMKSDPVFAPLFEEQQKLTGIEKEEFDFGSEVKVSHGFGQSPLSAEEILKLSSDELVGKLKEFRSEKKLEGMTVEALAGTLKEAVKANPDKFTDSLSFFEEVGFIYIYKILDGLKETWKAKKAIDWGKVFEFIMPYIKKDQFWKDVYVIEPGSWLGGADHHWVTTIVAELLQEGTGDDAWAFSEDYFDKAKEIIFSLIEEPKEKEEISDYVFHTLNTPCGKLITALVYLALRIARVNEKKGIKNDPKWSEAYKGKFNELLRKKVIDAYTSLGRFLPYLAYLDRNWVLEKIKGLAADSGSKYWVAFFEGYLSIGKVYEDLYELMRPHYEYGLSYDFKEKRNREHLIQHICIGYLRDRERLDEEGSLFKKIIVHWKPEQIKLVIGFFWMQREYLKENTEDNENMRARIIAFWKLLYERYKGKSEDRLSREDKQILSAVAKLASSLPHVDAESYKWLILSAPYVHEDFNSAFFIEYLNELKDKGERSETAKYIGDIYLKMLNKTTPDFDQEHIRSIVEFLYNADAADSASRICNIYGWRGYEFLRDIYEKYSKKLD